MREILFRGKRTDNGKWIYGNLFHNELSNVEWFYIAPKGRGFYGEYEQVDAETVGQYTGFKDIEGVKIFEGDIVIFVADEDTTRQIRMHDPEYPGHDPADVVKWHDKEARYYLYEDDDYTAFDFCHEHKIIGNIHDNPELV